MKEQILLLPKSTPRGIAWKPWKWIGLAVFAIVLLFGRWLPNPITVIGVLYGIVVIANLLFSLIRYLKDHFFWRVRNRLLGSYFFVGGIPLLTLFGLVALSAYFLMMELGMHYLAEAVRENERLVSKINAELAAHLEATDTEDASLSKADPVFSKYSTQFPALASQLIRRLPDGSLAVIAENDPLSLLRDSPQHPGDKWMKGTSSFEGILKDGKKSFLASLLPVYNLDGFYVETVAPIDGRFEDRLSREKSINAVFFNDESFQNIPETISEPGSAPSGEDRVTVEKEAGDKIAREIAMDRTRSRQNSESGSKVFGLLPLKYTMYESGENKYLFSAFFSVPPGTVFNAYLVQDDLQGRGMVWVLYFFISLFGFVVLISMIIGFVISRHVTRSVHDLYQGILAIQKGDLEYRIPERRRDQLGLMAYSFNRMSASISHLLQEVVEKKKIEKELEIAREVQATLFPKKLPHPPGMLVYGSCRPARVVSGDYYDFIVEDDRSLYLVVGDISGKGISAALLMANLQAAMRNRILSIRQDGAENTGQCLADVMAHLNSQVFLNSPAEKYATLFLCRYDADTRRLWYCNAGHPAPMVLTPGGMVTLKATGMAVGMFPDVTYESEFVELKPGALLAIFSDGATEAMNGADEEFGEDRLADILEQSYARSPEDIWRYVISKVDDWQGNLAQSDDITLIVAKVEQ